MSEMTQYLLDRGADPRKKNKEGSVLESYITVIRVWGGSLL